MMSDLHEALIRRTEVFGPIGDAPEVVRLLAEGADVEELDKYGFTPLRAVAMSGQTEFVKMLLAAGAKVDAANERGRTALMYAASQGRAEVVTLLLNAGANAVARDADGLSAFDLAARSGNGEIVRLLEAAGTHSVVASSSVTADDLAAIRRWWRHQAELWWAGSPRFDAVCDYCNRQVARGDGYLIGAKLGCGRCCERMLTDEARVFLAQNPDYFGAGLLENARQFAAE
jgi:hypothetical protein